MGIFFGLIALATIVLLTLVLTAGSSPHFLPTFYFLEISTANLNIPSTLENSTLLQGLSTLTGKDYVGKTATADSLGLADTYRIALWATCASYKNGTSICSPLKPAHTFNVQSGLNLDHKPGLNQALDQYSITALFCAISYTLSKLLILFTSILTFWWGRRRWAAIWGAIFCIIAWILLVAAGGAEASTFTKLRVDLNDAYSSIGLHVSLGYNLFILGLCARFTALLLWVILIFRARKLGRNAHYTRVGKQGAVLFDQKDARRREMSMDGDREQLVPGNSRMSVDTGHGDLGYAHPSSAAVKVKSLHRLPAAEKNSSYEPYRSMDVSA